MITATALPAQMRTELGTGAARELRRNGRVPATIYGSGKQPISVSIEEKEITKLYRKPSFISGLIELDIAGISYKVLPKAVDLHPITDIVYHVDFVFLNDENQKMDVPLVFEGRDRSIGIKRGGFFNIVKRTVKMICSVDDLPRNIVIDISNMAIGQSIKAKDIHLPAGCNLVDDTNFVVASMIGKAGKTEAEEAENKA